MADILLSIKPVYADRIMSGTKRYEYRKRMPALEIDRVVVYASKPVGRIVGEFAVKRVLTDTPAGLWARTHEHGGIAKPDYDGYFAGRTHAHAFEVSEVRRYTVPLDPLIFDEMFRAPQSFAYFASVSVKLELAISKARGT